MEVSRTERRWDIPASLLLLLALLFAAARLSVTDWVPNLTYAISLALLGGLLGMALGASRFSGRFSFLFALAYTHVVVPWQVSFVVQGTSDWTERLVSSLGEGLLTPPRPDRQVSSLLPHHPSRARSAPP